MEIFILNKSGIFNKIIVFSFKAGLKVELSNSWLVDYFTNNFILMNK